MNDVNGNFGRLAYFDPNVSVFENQNGNLSDSITFPYEDYSMAVDLIIREYNRYSCGLSNVTGEYKDYIYSTTDGTISFLSGTNIKEGDKSGNYNYLTTRYTDVSMTDPVDNTQECLGIESIDITYESWFHPQVTIKFVDVRGATVMLQAENAYYNPNSLGSNSQIYKAFFSFPYPLFILKVKGFYGKGVTYKLAINKTTIDFDANTGNFIITAEFIGHMYGIFADIPMNYIAIAPYTQEGSEYWNAKINDNTFCFRGPGGVIQSPMVTFPNLRVLIENAKNSPEYVALNEISTTDIENIDSEIASLNDILVKYNEVFGNDFSFECDSHPNVIYRMGLGVDSKDYETKVKEFFNALSAHDRTYSTAFKSRFGGGDSILKQVKNKKYHCVRFKTDRRSEDGFTSYNKFSFWAVDQSTNIDKVYIQDSPYVIEKIKGYNNGLSEFNVYVFEKGTTEKFEDIAYNEINNYLTELSENKEKRTQDFKKKQEEVIERALGFTPSIRNIYELVFAHMDTFLEIFYNKMKIIKTQLEGKSIERQKIHYPEVKDELTDTEARTNKAGEATGPLRSHYLPPFVAYYKENRDPTQTDTNGKILKKVLRWPGEMVNSGDLEEVDFIEQLIQASKMYFEDNNVINQIISSTNNASGKTYSSSSDVTKFIPLTTYDLANYKHMENPYMSVKRALSNNSDDIEGRIFFILAMRGFYYCSTNHNKDDDYSFGRVEAVNFYKAIGEDTSSKFFEFIKKYADNRKELKEQNFFVRTISGQNNINNNAKEIIKTWVDTNAVNINDRILSYDIGQPITYTYYIEETSAFNFRYLPLERFDPDKVKSDFVKGDELRFKKGYISSTNKSMYIGNVNTFKVGEELEGGSFLIIEERDYFKNIQDSFKHAIEASAEELKNREKDKNYTEGKISDFSEIRDKDFNRVADNVTTERDDHFYSKWSIWAPSEYDDSRKGLKKLMKTGTTSDFSHYYIKYPCCYDDDDDFIIGNTIFEDQLYLQQNDIVAKACLFMQAVPILGTNGGLEKESKNTITAKSVLLREGALIWFEKHKNEINFSGYKVPARGHWLCSNFNNTEDGFDTYRPLKKLQAVGQYFKYELPKYSTESRKAYLEQYFIQWANTEYKKLERLLMDKTLYKNGKYSNGLDVERMAENKATNETGDKMREVQNLLRSLFFQMCTTIDYYHGCTDETLSCGSGRIKDVFNGFMDQLENIYGKTVNLLKNNPDEINRQVHLAKMNDPFQNVDLKLSTYMTVKNLYDKWISGFYHGEETYRFRRRSGGNTYELDNFIYCDNFFHDIGDALKVNMTKVGDWLSSIIPSSEIIGKEGELKFKSESIYEFLSKIAQLCGGYLMAIPQRMMYLDRESISNAFKPIPTCQDWDDDTSTYMFLYTYKPSEHLGTADASNLDMNGWSPDGDGFDLTNEDIIGTLFNDDGTVVPAFGVTFAKQNQSYFKNISLTSKSPGVTEVGIANTMNIASKAGEEIRNTTLYGQDIYKIYSNYSYECTVEMLGCMQIFPPMYFQLNNIPMWKGAYMIQKVNHKIKPGDITTTFTGVRQNKYAIPMSDSSVIGFIPKEGSTASLLYKDINGGQIDLSNIGPTTEKNIDGDMNVVLTNINIDFDENNITDEKPLICLLPAHSTQDGKIGKSKENAWSRKLINDYIYPKLVRFNFKDGTSFSKNVHKCKTSESSSGGYSAREVNSLVNKYGSKKVISIVPHWNACGGQYFMVFDGKQIGTKINGNSWKDPRDQKMRGDSAKLAAYVRVEAEKVIQRYNNGEFNLIPEGMMNNGVSKTHLLYTESYQNDMTDPGVNPNCACILTENFFADYKTGGPSWKDDENYKTMNNGRYQNGRAWLESEEGLNVIAEIHVNGIINYINSIGTADENYYSNNGQANGYNIDAACQWIQRNSNKSSIGKCAKYVRSAIDIGFYTNPNGSDSYTGKHRRPINAREYSTFLPTIGFKKVATFPNTQAHEYNPQKGDIAVYKKGTDTNHPGHICMYDGSRWCSDFKQNNMYIYGSLYTPEIDVFRFAY